MGKPKKTCKFCEMADTTDEWVNEKASQACIVLALWFGISSIQSSIFFAFIVWATNKLLRTALISQLPSVFMDDLTALLILLFCWAFFAGAASIIFFCAACQPDD